MQNLSCKPFGTIPSLEGVNVIPNLKVVLIQYLGRVLMQYLVWEMF